MIEIMTTSGTVKRFPNTPSNLAWAKKTYANGLLTSWEIV